MKSVLSSNIKGKAISRFKNRRKEDLIRGALRLLSAYGPGTYTQILYSQEITTGQTKTIIKWMADNGLITVTPTNEELLTMLKLPNHVRNIVAITPKGEKYLKLTNAMEELIINKPSSVSYKHSGDRDFTSMEIGNARRTRYVNVHKKLVNKKQQ